MDSFYELENHVDIRTKLKESLREIQKNVIQVISFGTVLTGIFFILSSSFFPDSLQGVIFGLVLIISGSISLFSLQHHYWIAEVVMMSAMISVIFGLTIWMQNPLFLLFFGLVLSLLVITTNYWFSAFVAIGFSLLVIIFRDDIAISPLLGVILILEAWITMGVTILTFIPLSQASKVSFLNYSQASKLLAQVRNSQLILQQTLKDLEESNVQLTRLNQLTQELYKEAEVARQAKQQFVANVSHELRTPMNMILGYGEMILKNPYKKKLPPALMADLGVIVRNSQHLSGLVDDVLDMSQLETDQMNIFCEELDLMETIESAIEVVKPLYDTKNLNLVVDKIDQASAYFDRTRIREVLINLLSNAGRFTNEGFVHVSVRREGNYYITSIQDSGPGIPKKAQNKLFQPFQQVDTSLKRRYGGTGLGLAISKSLIELHGGKIWLESEEGQGTTFYFSLPITPPKEPKTGTARWLYHDYWFKERSEASKAPKPIIRPRYVVIDHSDSLHRVMKRYYNDIDLIHVPDVPDAIHTLRESPVKAVIIRRDDMADTLQTYSDVRDLPEEVPVIICSIPDIQVDPFLNNILHYLVKPIRVEALLDIIEKNEPPVRTILIVDDESDELQMFKRMILSMSGKYRVITAYNGIQALSAIEMDRPDLIILDLIMPEMNGYEFMAIRNKDAKLRQIPVIVISAQDPMSQPVLGEGMVLFQKNGLHVRKILEVVDTFSQSIKS